MEQSLPTVSSSTTVDCEILAQAPLNLQAKLANELVYVPNSSLILTNYLLERRRLFQNLLYRYFRQILHGCKNAQCNFPTCRSYRKRTSKGPFRDFTNLSAWTLATFLATQDNAEWGLCPNEPATVQHEPGRYPQSNNTDQTPISIAPDLETTLQHGNVGSNTKPPHKKDFKSITQSLFDTASMKLLRPINVAEELSEWKEAAEAGDDRDDAVETDNRKSDDESRVGEFSQLGIMSCEKNTEVAELRPVKDVLRWRGADMKSFTPGLWHINNNRFGAILNIQDPALIDSGSQSTTEFGRTHGGIDTEFPQYKLAHDPQGSRSEFTKTSSSFSKNGHDNPVAKSCPIMPVVANSRLITPLQTLSRFTVKNLKALSTAFEIFSPNAHDKQKPLCTFGRKVSHFRLDSLVNGNATRREREIAFVSQSIIFVLSSSDSLLKSFRDPVPENPMYECDFLEVIHAFTPLLKVHFLERCLFSSLLHSASKLYQPKYDSSRNATPNRSLGSEAIELNAGCWKSTPGEKALNDEEAIHIAKIALAALIARVPEGTRDRTNTWLSFRKAHAMGRAVYQDLELELMDIFDDELSIEVMTILVRALVDRYEASEITRLRETQFTNGENFEGSPENILEKLLHGILYPNPFDGVTNVVKRHEISRYHAEILLVWLRSMILKGWDGKAWIHNSGTVGCALEFMSYLFEVSCSLGIDPASFETPFLFRQFKLEEMTTERLFPVRAPPSTTHLLDFRFLFSREMLVSYFRAANFAEMTKKVQDSRVVEDSTKVLAFAHKIANDPVIIIARNKFLVLRLRRENILTDFMNQLWRRERRELLKPLRVHLDVDEQEGEEGVDQGGVQHEFMRLVTSELMKPDYGLFTTDDQTQMSWFQPFSPQPLYKFELIGLIISLALYNGLTIPVTFPLALYRKLLIHPMGRLEHIEDGWPSLTKGLQDLLAWTDGSVEDIFDLQYRFDVEAFGKPNGFDLGEIESDDDYWPSSQRFSYGAKNTDTQVEAASDLTSSQSKSRKTSSSTQSSGMGNDVDQSANGPSCGSADECSRPRRSSTASPKGCMVTEENRGRYVEDYIFWLTDKSIRPQYRAFSRGFYTCISYKAVSIFSPEDLKSVVEGIQTINVDELWHTTTYENGYFPRHRVIEDFWDVVRDLSPTQLKQLLEFVTASDRVPAQGLSNIQFVIVRNGDADERLPTSITCFGRLLLPEYSSRSILKDRLCTAIQHCKGFGLM